MAILAIANPPLPVVERDAQRGQVIHAGSPAKARLRECRRGYAETALEWAWWGLWWWRGGYLNLKTQSNRSGPRKHLQVGVSLVQAPCVPFPSPT